MSVRVEVLGREHEDAVRTLADVFAAEWPEWAATLSREALEDTFRSGPGGKLPVVLAAFEDDSVVGTVCLRAYFDEAPMPESPWVRGLYVMPPHRGRGIDRLLMRAVEAEARRRGFTRIHAATTRIEKLGARWGWRVFHRLEHKGEPMSWAWRDVAPE